MYTLLGLVVQVLYLFAPLLLSALLSGLVMRLDLLRSLRYPIDAGKSVDGKRLFGDSKTWRGVFVAVFGCIVGTAIQKHVIGAAAGQIALLDYRSVDPVAFGTLLGVGAMLGELPNSFVKRRLGIAPGTATRGPLSLVFVVWDQIDLLTLTWPLLSCWVRPTLSLIATSAVVALLLHPLSSLVGYLVGARTTAR
jgi:hypothetical protein